MKTRQTTWFSGKRLFDRTANSGCDQSDSGDGRVDEEIRCVSRQRRHFPFCCGGDRPRDHRAERLREVDIFQYIDRILPAGRGDGAVRRRGRHRLGAGPARTPGAGADVPDHHTVRTAYGPREPAERLHRRAPLGVAGPGGETRASRGTARPARHRPHRRPRGRRHLRRPAEAPRTRPGANVGPRLRAPRRADRASIRRCSPNSWTTWRR